MLLRSPGLTTGCEVSHSLVQCPEPSRWDSEVQPPASTSDDSESSQTNPIIHKYKKKTPDPSTYSG